MLSSDTCIQSTKKDKLYPYYDAIIIGAGIAGLVCAAFLAKCGKKVLLVEQHFIPGGYCTSFLRGRVLPSMQQFTILEVAESGA